MFIALPDPSKRAKNLKKHGYDLADLTVEFFDNAKIVPANYGREKAIGMFFGDVITVIFKRLGSEALTPISMRPASYKERRE